MHEPDEHPLRDQRRLRGTHGVEQREIAIVGVGRIRVVAGDGVIGQPPQQVHVAAGRHVLEGADPQVAARDTGQHRARQRRLALHGAPRGDHRQRPRGRDAKRVHGLADDVFAKHRPDRRKTVAAPRERRCARTLEVKVAKASIGRREFAQQQCPAVAQTRNIAAELVSGIGLGHGHRTLGNQVADQKTQPVLAAQPAGFDAELGGQGLVEYKQTRFGGGFGLPADGQLRQLAREAVVQVGCNAHLTQTTEGHRSGSVR